MTESEAKGTDSDAVEWPEPEMYTPERIAEFLLNCAVSQEEYQTAVQEVIAMGIGPATIPHTRF